jgi:cation diffusion facilitator family transporter
MAIEGGLHLYHAEHADARDSLPVAVLGFVVNLVSTMILRRDQRYGHGHGDHHGHGHGHGHGHHHGHGHDHRAKPQPGTLDFNLRAAYIHIVADAMTSLLTIAALALSGWADLWYLDPLMGLVGGAVIFGWAVSLCRQASGQLLDVVSSPRHEQIVRERLEAIDDVRVADLHVWELGPGRRSCIVSLVTARPREVTDYRDAVLAALDIAHLTIEVHRCALPHDDHDAHGHDDGPAH